MSAVIAKAALGLSDRLAVQEVVHAFAHASDYGDWEALAALYTDDVVTEMEGQSLRFEGVDAQLAHARKSAEVSGGKNRHYFMNMIVDGEGDTAWARYMFVNLFAGTEPMKPRIVCTGRQVDTLHRTENGWRIARRHVRFDQQLEIHW